MPYTSAQICYQKASLLLLNSSREMTAKKKFYGLSMDLPCSLFHLSVL